MIVETERNCLQIPKGGKIEVGEKLFMVGMINSNVKWWRGTVSGESLPANDCEIVTRAPSGEEQDNDLCGTTSRELMEQLSEVQYGIILAEVFFQYNQAP